MPDKGRSMLVVMVGDSKDDIRDITCDAYDAMVYQEVLASISK